MANLPKLVPLKVLFGNPYRTSPQVSPDGQTISFLAPSKDKDVLNVWVCDSDGSNERMITEDALRGIRMYRWSEDSKFILYLQDVGGDENFHLFAQPIEPGADARDLTPGEGVRAQNLLTDKQFPQEVLVGLNKRNPQVFDMYRVNLASGESELDTENPGDVLQWVTDADFQIRGAVSMNPADGSTTLRTRQSTDDAHCSGEWKSIVTWPQEENGGPVAFTQDGASMYVESSLGVDTTRLIKIDATNGKEQEVVTYNDKADVGQVVMDDNTRKLLAANQEGHTPVCEPASALRVPAEPHGGCSHQGARRP
jgi:dipeptidyl aminopeptidase/acylaminoacyl peptidase